MAVISFKKLAVGVSAAALSMAYVVPSYASNVDDPWLIRLRAVNVIPDESATIEAIEGTVDISNTLIPELDISYFWTENIATELVLGTTPHDVQVIDSAIGNVDIGDVWLLPPTVMLQYHFSPRSTFRSYLGVGVNYTIFYGADSGDVVDVDYDNNFALALQAGFDAPINDTYFFNVDVKKLYLQTDVTVDAGGLGVVGADVDINPWIVGVGVGRRF